jgi:hypothetical protein
MDAYRQSQNILGFLSSLRVYFIEFWGFLPVADAAVSAILHRHIYFGYCGLHNFQFCDEVLWVRVLRESSSQFAHASFLGVREGNEHPLLLQHPQERQDAQRYPLPVEVPWGETQTVIIYAYPRYALAIIYINHQQHFFFFTYLKDYLSSTIFFPDSSFFFYLYAETSALLAALTFFSLC